MGYVSDRPTPQAPFENRPGVGGQPASSPAMEQSPTSPIRLLLVDDHAVIRQGLLMLLSDAEQIEVVGEAGDGQTALRMSGTLHPDVVLMDVSMPEMDGVQTTRRLTAQQPEVKVIGLSMHDDESVAAAMTGAGAVAYLCKGCSARELIETIRQVAHDGQTD